MEAMKIITVDAVVVGTGAAGFNAACRIRQEGKKQVALVTEGIKCGTSRNTGSDKQTYYKLGLAGDSMDSVRQMAQNLFAGGSLLSEPTYKFYLITVEAVVRKLQKKECFKCQIEKRAVILWMGFLSAGKQISGLFCFCCAEYFL